MIPIQYRKEELIDSIHKLKKMRKCYRLSYWFPFLKDKMYCDMGMCYNYHSLFHSGMRSYFMTDLHRIAWDVKGFINQGFWFRQGKIRPRLKTIKKSIKYYETIYRERFGTTVSK